MYDYIFITPLPAFYKISLYNELAKKMKIFVVFIGESSVIRTDDFTQGQKEFDYEILNEGHFETRNAIISSIKLTKLLFKLEYKKIVVGGWDFFEYWFSIYFNAKSKNGVIVESTSLESNLNFVKKTIKKIFFKRISLAFPPGRLHADLLYKLGYNNKFVLTKGVGIFHRVPYTQKTKEFQKKFLYIGRLSEEKNLELLIAFFNKYCQYSLTIIGKGTLKENLAKQAKYNIQFINHVPNEKISEMYLDHDVFILPSHSETWGLVIDEALYFNLPVIVSNKVGCASELVIDKYNGIILKNTTEEDLLEAIQDMETRYKEYQINLRQMDFSTRDRQQVNAYLEGLT